MKLQGARRITNRNGERGLIITLVAAVLLFVIGAMAVLAIDVSTFYTARSQAQMAADGAALAGARVLANSGMTSCVNCTNYTSLATDAQNLATRIATQVATQNEVGGRNLQTGEVVVTISLDGGGYDPRVTVQVTRSDLPTYFARIWGNTIATVTANATAEAYNPSGTNANGGGNPLPLALTCVKPWILPNLDPLGSGTATIFDPNTGAIQDSSLIGNTTLPRPLQAACGPVTGCSAPAGVAVSAWKYFPGDPTTTFQPVQASPSCASNFSGTYVAYQLSIAGCVQSPLACGQNSIANLYTTYTDGTPNTTSTDAANCLTHSENGKGDTLNLPWDGKSSFQFLAGADNPVVAAGKDVLVSDSVVTLPVANVTTSWAPINTSNGIQIIGFVQLFLNPNGSVASGGPSGGVPGVVTNLVGCGANASGPPTIYGNGSSPVIVRLVRSQPTGT